jgi:hypothetical protein
VAHKIIITPFAHEDEYDAYSWYEKRRKGLGEELLKELEIAYEKISNNPERLFKNGIFIHHKQLVRRPTAAAVPLVVA